MANIYVGNLPFSATEAQLQEAFSAHGAVSSAKIVADRETGRSRGFGFIEMANDTEANAAIQALNGWEMDGRKLVVSLARAKRQG